MNQRGPRTLSVFAPAKVNLFLHVTGRRADGYHTLDSLVAFADIGDRLTLAPAGDFSLTIQGPYAGAFTAQERTAGPDSANLVARAAHALARAVQRPLDLRMTLIKNLPLAAGVGGGSADAAAALWALLDWWGLPPQAVPGFDALMGALGADVPACFSCRPQWMAGVGEILSPAAGLPEVPVVLVNPGKLCRTADVFARFGGDYASERGQKPVIDRFDGLIAFLRQQDNMLAPAATALAPEIASAQEILARQAGCALARMTGSGATCFGLFDGETAALAAAEDILGQHPNWWVRAGTLNRPERY